MTLSRTVLLIILFLSFYYLTSCENSDIEINKFKFRPEIIDVIIKSDIYHSSNGFVKLKISGDTILYYPQKNLYIFPSGIQIKSFDSSANLISTLVADSANYFGDEEVVFFFQNVIVINTQKYDTLFAEDLQINSRKDSISTNNKVHLVTRDQNIIGTGMFSTVNLEKIKIFNPKGFLFSNEDTLK